MKVVEMIERIYGNNPYFPAKKGLLGDNYFS
jgi:hypothetical protein